MNADHANAIMAKLEGYWPIPRMQDEEALAWVQELTNPNLRVTVEEANTLIDREVHAGDRQHRMTPGQFVVAVQTERRHRTKVDETVAAVEESRGYVKPDVARKWFETYGRQLRGETRHCEDPNECELCGRNVKTSPPTK